MRLLELPAIRFRMVERSLFQTFAARLLPRRDPKVFTDCDRWPRRHGAGNAVHGSGEDLNVVEVGAPVRVDDQDAVERRGTIERDGVGGRGSDLDDQVAAGRPDAVK